ncbi:MAG: cohesin domain-containing protein [Planctomycetota bacterium]|nr:cohesin domain-containing protein [Planctomycetota bacterium]
MRGTYNTTGYAYGVQVVGTLAYVADYDSGLQVIDVSNPATPVLRGTYNTTGYAYGVQVVGTLAYVADYDSGLQVIDVSNPAAIISRGFFDTAGSAQGVAIARGCAFIADGPHHVVTIPLGHVRSVDRVAGSTYRISLWSPLPAGDYTLTVGSSIQDTLGRFMDQDGDGIPGELAEDRFSGSITIQAAVGGVYGVAYHDLDNSRSRDSNEAGLEGWTVYLDQNRNSQLDLGETSTVTDANGQYQFSNLAAGTYVVAEQGRTGWDQTYPVGSASAQEVVVGSGAVVTGVDFGTVLRREIKVASATVNMGEGQTASFTMRLSQAVTGGDIVVVTLARAAGDPDVVLQDINGSPLTSIVFTAYNWSGVQIYLCADDEDALDEQASFVATATGWQTGNLLVNVTDDDRRIVVTGASGPVSVTEGMTSSLSVSLAGCPAEGTSVVVSVARATGADSDLEIASGATLTFTATNWHVPQTVTIRAKEDADAIDGTASFTFASSGWTSNSVQLREADNDRFFVFAFPAGGLSVPEAGPEAGKATFQLSLKAQPGGDVYVRVDRSGPAITPDTVLRFSAGGWNKPQTVTLFGLPDDFDAVDDLVTLSVSAESWQPVTISVTQLDDDRQIVVAPTTPLSVHENGTATYGVWLKGKPAGSVSVHTTRILGDTDLGLQSGAELTFDQTNWNIPQTVTLTAGNDMDTRDDEASFVSRADGWLPGTLTAREADDDRVILVSTNSLAVEEGKTAALEVVLKARPERTVNVQVTRSTAGNPDTDLSVVSGGTLVFTPDNWSQPQQVTLKALTEISAEDAIDGTATFLVQELASGIVTDPWEQASFEAREADDDRQFVLSAQTVTVPEGQERAYQIHLKAQPSGDVVVNTVRLTGDSDLQVTAGELLTFTPANWNVDQNIVLSAADDGDVTDGTAIFVSASPGWNSKEVTANEDDDGNLLELVIAGPTVPEAATRQIKLRLKGQPQANVLVTVERSSGDSDLTVSSGASLRFTPDDWNVYQFVTLAAADDLDTENGQAVFTITAAEPGAVPTVLAIHEADDDRAILASIDEISVPENGTVSYKIWLKGQPSSDVTVTTARTAGGSDDLEVTGGTAWTFTPDAWDYDHRQVVTLSGVADPDARNEVLLIASTADSWTPAEVVATEVDADRLVVFSTSELIVTEGQTGIVQVWLAQTPEGDVEVELAIRGDADLAITSSATLTFTTGNWDQPQTITLAAALDADARNGTAALVASAEGWQGGEVPVAEEDVHVAGIVVSPTAGLVTTEAGGTAQFAVKLLTPPADTVTIPVSVSNATEGAVSIRQLVFTPLDWDQWQTVTAAGVNDAVDDGDVAYQVVLGVAASASLEYAGLEAADVALTNSDDDTAGVAISVTSGLYTTEAGGAAEFSVVLTTQPAPLVLSPVDDTDTAFTAIGIWNVVSNAGGYGDAYRVHESGTGVAAADWNVGGLDDGVYEVLVTWPPLAGLTQAAAYTVSDGTTVLATVRLSQTAAPSGETLAGQAWDSLGLFRIRSGSLAVKLSVSDGQRVVADALRLVRRDLRIPIEVDNPQEAVTSTTELVFTTEDWFVPQKVTVAGLGDTLDDGDVVYRVVTGPALSGDTDYRGLNAADVTLTNLDEDYPVDLSLLPENLLDVNGTLYFTAVTPQQGRELWKTLGTTAGAVMVADINPGTGSSFPSNLIDVGGTLYFTAFHPASGFELWKSDGTVAGTVQVTDLRPGPSHATPANLLAIGTKLFFTADDGVTGRELYTLNAVGGADPVKDINVGLGSSSPEQLIDFNGVLAFTAFEPVHGRELWVSNGTAEGTRPVRDIRLGTASSNPGNLTVLGSRLVFAAADGLHGAELWSSDGTEAGTVLLKDIHAGPGDASPTGITVVGSSFYFAAFEPVTGTELWRSDGTEAGTVLVADLRTDGSSNPTDLVAVDSTLFFVADDGLHGSELWSSNGTADGTIRLTDINPGAGNSQPENLTHVNPLYFTAYDPETGYELWQTNGTADGTHLVDDINASGVNGATPIGLTKSGNALYFVADDGSTGRNLWTTSPLASGAQQVPVADILLFPESGPTVVTEGGSGGHYTIALATRPTADVTVTIAGDLQISVTPSQLIFTADTWNVPQTIAVASPEDTVVEGDQRVALVHAMTSADPTYANLAPRAVEIQVLDNDGPLAAVQVSFADSTGRPIDRVWIGQPFRIYVSGQDLRTVGAARGVVAAAMDLTFDSGLVSISAVQHMAAFAQTISGIIDQTGGLVDDAGGSRVAPAAVAKSTMNRVPQPVFYLDAVATAAGTVVLATNAADSLSAAFQLTGMDRDIRAAVAYGTASLSVVSPTVTVTRLVTHDTTPALAGTIDDFTASLEVTVAGHTYAAVNHGNGTWSLPDNTITPPLGEGVYDVLVIAKQGDLAAGGDSTLNELLVDLTPPIVTVMNLTTSDATPALHGTIDDATATVSVTLATKTYLAENRGDGTWLLPDNTINPGLADGTYDVHVVAEDPAGNQVGDTTSNELTMVASSLGVSLTPTSVGFVARFNHALERSVLNLYDQGNLLGSADVELMGQRVGAVRGSLVPAVDARGVTFVKTGGVLEADTYTVRLKSGTNAFRDTAGNLLDGNGDGVTGDDFVTSFTVATPDADTVTVSLPDFARGYGQPVNLPTNVLTAGLPLKMSTGLGVSGVDLIVHYDPALLEIQDFTVDGALAANGVESQLTFPSVGTALLHLDAERSFSSTAGPLTVGTFTARVPDGAPYAAKQILDITDLHVYDDGPAPAELPSQDDDAIHVAAFFGDTNGSGTYNSPDATLIRRIIGQVDTGLSAYQMVDPVLIADITLNDAIQSNDTIGVRRVIGRVAVANVPALPTGLTLPAVAGYDPKIYIPQNLSGGPGGTVSVPVKMQVTEPAGITISGFDLVVEFDPTRLALNGVELGTLFAGTDLSGTLTQPAAGKLIYVVDSFSGTPLYAWDTVGDIVTLTFTVAADASPGETPINLLSTWGSTSTAMFDNDLNDLTLSPAPTNAASDQIDGVLTIGTTAGFTLSKTAATVTEPNTTDTFTMVLTRQPLTNVVFSVAASDASEATVDKATLTFTPANWNTAQTVTITAVDDAIVDGAVTSTVTVSVVDASSDNAFDPLADQTVAVTTNDDDTAPTADIVNVTPDPQNTAVSAIQIVFSEPISGFDLADIVLTCDGGSNLLTAAQTLTTIDSLTWTLANLSGVTGVSGSYRLQLTAAGSGIRDAAGNALGGDASDAWTTLVVGLTWQNLRHPCDVTGDGSITSIDVLTLISDIDTNGSRDLETALPPTPAPPPFLDPSGDGQLTPIDVLIVIIYINAFGPGPVPTVSGGEGESTEPPVVFPRIRLSDTDSIEHFPSVHPANGRGDTIAPAVSAQDLIARGPTEQRPTVTAPTQERLRPHRQDGIRPKSSVSTEFVRPTKSPDNFLDLPLETLELEQAISAIATDVARAWSF